MSLRPATENSCQHESYVGLDLLRIAAAFGVVLLHVYATAGQPDSISLLVKLRDFSLPVMVLSSFFLFSASLIRKSESRFGEQLLKRGKRLWLPMIAWTAIYSVVVGFILPIVFDFEGSGFPQWFVFLTGYRHLWYLQFLFLGSLLLFGVIILLKRLGRGSKDLSPGLLLFAAAGLLFVALNFYTSWNIGEETDLNVAMFVSQTTTYLPLIPLGAGLAFARFHIAKLLGRTGAGVGIFVAAIAAAVLHVSTENVPLTREIFALAVFLAALLPFDGNSVKRLAPLSVNSYGVYVLHFLPVQVIWIFTALKGYEIGATGVIILSVFIYAVCFFATSLLRRIPFFDAILPSVPTVIPPSEPSEGESTLGAVSSARGFAA